MANRCAGLDPTWAHLPAPAPTLTAHAAAGHCSRSSPAWLLSPAAAFENEALTSALRASMAPAHTPAAASSASYPTTPSSSSTSSASELLSGAHDHDAPAASRGPGPARDLIARPAGGRVAKPKRKPRPSRRTQTTYITADPANFRRMVQEITGLAVVRSTSISSITAPAPAAATAPSWTPPPQACALPTLDTSAFLLDRAAVAATAAQGREDKSHSVGCARNGRHGAGGLARRGRYHGGAAGAGGYGRRLRQRLLPDLGELGNHLMTERGDRSGGGLE
ncbi:hypothetical protein ACP70R_030099 [Stipagrostis hirtigluma subsp. patula]